MFRNRNPMKDEAVSLRQMGYSYGLIKEKIGVSKSTLCGWLKLLPYKPNSEVLERMERGRQKSSEKLRKSRLKRIRRAREIARSELGQISKRDLMLLGIGLYIGEGAKYDRGFTQFTNSDPKVVKIMMNWFIQILGLSHDNFYLRLHIYPDNKVEQTIKFWSSTTGIPVNQFGKPFIDRRVKKSSKSKRKLPHGTLHIRIRGLGKEFAWVGLYQKILAWIELIERQNFAGIV